MNKYKTLHLKFVTFILTLIMTIGMIYIGEAKKWSDVGVDVNEAK